MFVFVTLSFITFCLTSRTAYQQDQLVQNGVIPRLVSIVREYPENDLLVNVCLLALCNLADMGNNCICFIISYFFILFAIIYLFYTAVI